IGVADDTGLIIAAQNENLCGENFEGLPEYVADHVEMFKLDKYTVKVIRDKNRLEYFVFIAGDDADAEKSLKMFAICIQNLKLYYDDKYDKGYFIKNVLLDNVLPGDIVIKARELHIQLDAHRVLFLIRTYEKSGIYVPEMIENLFPTKNKDFIFALDEYNSVLVKEVKDNCEPKDLEKLAKIIINTLNSEAMVKAFVGVGTVARHVKDLARSYKEAQVALEVGKVFESQNYIMMYNTLGIGRLVYQLPTTLCELFLEEVFEDASLDSLDSETLLTINKFFECNLNVSETSRKLFVHRNTLVYRLDKIQKITNLDLRIFEHAIIFKVAMMVKKYLDSNPIRF
ncbi:MAG: helix-turn-helix domain-containing protein, partial [Hyphomonadaceae bacterium]|nr:helix-turn-helix domain-containing protein [Clostridia bacterium]